MMTACRATAAMVAFTVTWCVAGQTSPQFSVRHYQATEFDREFTCCPLPDGIRQVALSIDLSEDLQPAPLVKGEILLVTAEFMARQTAGTHAVSMGGGIYLGTSAAYDPAEESDNYQIVERHGQNLARPVGLIDETYVKVGTYCVPASGAFDQRRTNVNLYMVAKHKGPGCATIAMAGRCRLSVLRFTPTTLPVHGWSAVAPAPAEVVIQRHLGSVPTVIYQIDLDDPDADPRTADRVDVRLNDLVLILGEFQASTTSLSMVRVHSKVVLVDSNGVEELDITCPNSFSLKAGVRGMASSAKAGSIRVTHNPANAGSHWRFLRLAASTKNLEAATHGGRGALTVDITPNRGMLSLVRFRPADVGDKPFHLTRLDQPEFNQDIGRPDEFHFVEQFCKVGAYTNKNDFATHSLMVQRLGNLEAGELIIALSELSATNEDHRVKSLGSQLILVDDATGTMAEISKPNATEMDTTMHHLHYTKVAVRKIESALATASIRRSVWSREGFDGNCENSAGPHPGTCSCCLCPPLAPPGQGAECDWEFPTVNISCDAIVPGNGRLAVLRLRPLDACFADCFPNPIVESQGAPDRMVNIDDLVHVMTHWSNSTTGCWGDVTGNSDVDIDDLIAVLAAWGACP